jgi:hypothetical protein
MGEKKKRESNNLHRPVHMGNGSGGHTPELTPCKSTITKNAVDDRRLCEKEPGEWLPVRASD